MSLHYSTTGRASGVMMPGIKGLDPANLRANLRKTAQSDAAKKVCTIVIIIGVCLYCMA